MDWYRIYADDLDEEELDYELAIRACPLVGGQETRRRELRNLLRDPDSSKALVVSDRMMQANLEIVPYKHQRIRRCVPRNPVEFDNRRLLLDTVADLARRYFHLDFRTMETPGPQDDIMVGGTANSPRVTMQATSGPRPGEDGQVNPVRSNSSEASNVEGAVGGDFGPVTANRQWAANNPGPDSDAFHLWRTTASQQQSTGAIPRAARPSVPEFVQSPPQLVSSLNFNFQNPQQGGIPTFSRAPEVLDNQQNFTRPPQPVQSRPVGTQYAQRGDEVRQSSRITVESFRVPSSTKSDRTC